MVTAAVGDTRRLLITQDRGMCREPGFWHWPVREVEVLGLGERLGGVPKFVAVAEIVRVFVGGDVSELAREEIVRPVRDDQTVLAVEVVDDFHVVLIALGGVNRGHDARELLCCGLDEDDL